jgi:hypothetical protein
MVAKPGGFHYFCEEHIYSYMVQPQDSLLFWYRTSFKVPLLTEG